MSNLGNVRRVYDKHIKANVNHNGYKTVSLYDNNIGKHFYVHRIVAETFLSNPNKWPVVNHKNGVKDDNRVENLEWCTHKYNSQHSKIVLKHTYKGTHIMCVETGDVFESTKSVERITGLLSASIRMMLAGKHKTAYGYHWEYTDKAVTNIDCSAYKRPRLKKDIAKQIGIEPATLCWRLRNGWKWSEIKGLKPNLANRFIRR